MKKKLAVICFILLCWLGINGCGASSGGKAVEEAAGDIEKETANGEEVQEEPDSGRGLPVDGMEPETGESSTVRAADGIQGATDAEAEKKMEDSVPEKVQKDMASDTEKVYGKAEDCTEAEQEDFREDWDWQGMSWYEGYQVLLDNPALVDAYGVFEGDFGYLKMYFGEENCQFDSYWLCDADGNGVPELFLYSSAMGLTTVFTYHEQPVFLLDHDIYGINFETKEAIIHGHWHGAGGTWENEWWAFELGESSAEWSMLIDCWLFPDGEGREKPYDVYLPREGIDETTADGDLYYELYDIHVKPCIPIENYTRYDISDKSGLDRIQ